MKSPYSHLFLVKDKIIHYGANRINLTKYPCGELVDYTGVWNRSIEPEEVTCHPCINRIATDKLKDLKERSDWYKRHSRSRIYLFARWAKRYKEIFNRSNPYDSFE